MDKSVYIVGGGWGGYSRMFANQGWEEKDEMADASFVLFTGGEDVTPSLYNERNTHSGNNTRRDIEEIAAFEQALAAGKNLLGICRGSQFLTVMSGHSLWQDVDNHAMGGTHEATLTETGEVVPVTSTHHQMMRLDGDTEYRLMMTAGRTKVKQGGGKVENQDPFEKDRDIEAVYYPSTKAFAFQPHPEMVDENHLCQITYFKLIKELF